MAKFPPLPEPYAINVIEYSGIAITKTEEEALFTADQLLAYALEIWRMAMEAAATTCDDKERRKWEILRGGGQLEGIGPLDCAAAIRSLPEPSHEDRPA